MEFEDADCFDDLVTCNIRYLKGELDETPVNLGPLCEESALIVDQLIEICKKHVLTICSQPAYVRTDRRQRGFINFAIRCDARDLANILRQTDLDYVVRQGGYCTAKFTKTCAEERLDYSQVKVGDGWDTRSGACLEHIIADISIEYQFYETDSYDIRCDPDITFVIVCDEKYGLPTTNCCDELLKVLSMVDNY